MSVDNVMEGFASFAPFASLATFASSATLSPTCPSSCSSSAFTSSFISSSMSFCSLSPTSNNNKSPPPAFSSSSSSSALHPGGKAPSAVFSMSVLSPLLLLVFKNCFAAYTLLVAGDRVSLTQPIPGRTQTSVAKSYTLTPLPSMPPPLLAANKVKKVMGLSDLTSVG